MKTLSLFIFIALLAPSTLAQTWLLGSSSNFTNEAFDIKKDSQGNSIMTGYFSGQTNFQGIFLESQNGYSDIYIVKINSLGNVVWARSFGGSQADRGLKLAIDASDNIFVTGYFSGTMAMDATTLSSNNNSRDFFLAKLDPSGNVLWARSDGGSMGETAYDITLDSQNNCIVTGQFEGTTNIGGTVFTSQWDPINNVPSFDIFVAKFNASGAPLWVKNGMSEYEDRGIAITCDAADNVYVTGQFSDTLVFLGQNVNNQIYNAGFVAKISPAGSLLWLRKLSAAQTLAYDIELNALNEIYITGDFLGTMTFWDNVGLHQITNPYSKKIFLMKISNQGDFIWGKANGSDSEVSSRALLIDDAQDVYFGGYFKCNFDEYRDSSATGLWNSVGFRDVFMSKFSPSGNMLWNKHAGGKKDDMCYALAPGNNDEPIFAGSFTNHFNVPATSLQLTNYATNGSVQYESEYFPFFEVQGDETKNSFVGKAISSNTPDLFYYQNTPYNSISPDLSPTMDTLEGCAPFNVYFDPNTYQLGGPGYNIAWSDGSNEEAYHIDAIHPEGMVYLETSRWDGCSSVRDSIFVKPYPAPQMPLLSDDHAFNDSTPVNYNVIKLCYPDTAQVWFSNICVNCTIETTSPDGSWTVSGTGPFPVWESGPHNVSVTNEWGCNVTTYFNVLVENVTPPDTILPHLVLYDPLDWNDSISVCEGDVVSLVATDLLTNPAGVYIPYNHVYAEDLFTALNFANVATDPLHNAYFLPTFTGWYVIQYDTWLGTNNMCGLDTAHFMVIDSFYIEVLPNPVMIQPVLTSDGSICPGELFYISTSATYTNFSWSGTAITWTSAAGDSIQLTQPGQYIYNANYTDSVTGCTSYVNASITITEKSPPPISMNPEDGIVCPFDSVHLNILQAGTYNWFGPEGYSLGTGPDIYTTEQGFYHCVFTDNDGCEMTTPQVEVKEYTTPYLEISPSNSLCVSGEVEITAIYGGDATVQWIAPLNSSDNTVTVTTPGTYYCQITQCGITVTDSVVVSESTFTATLTASDTMLCYGEEITLSTIPGMAQYEWSSGQGTGSSITISTPGNYQVTVTNAEGCVSTSQVVNIGEHSGSAPPSINDVEICPGVDVTLTDNTGQTTFWYSDSTSTLPDFTGNSLTITNITSDTVIYVTYENLHCPPVFDIVSIHINDTVIAPQIYGDLEICAGEMLQLTSDSIEGATYNWMYNGNTVSSAVSCNIPMNQLISGEMVYLSVDFLCSSAQDSAMVYIIPQDTLRLNLDSLIVCAGIEHQFYPDTLFNGVIQWQNGSNIFIGDTLSVLASEITDPFLVAYGTDTSGCSTLADTVRLFIPDITLLEINLSGIPCLGSAVTLESNTDAMDFNWITSSGDTVSTTNLVIQPVDYSNDGWYFLIADDTLFGCELTDSIYINPVPLPVFDIPDTTICADNLFWVYPPVNDQWTFTWSSGGTSAIAPDSSGVYLLTATNASGCSYTDTIHVNLVNCDPVAPNVITANGDGVNDFFVIPNAEFMYGNYLIIHNRWGNIVYETRDYTNQFDGGELPEGVYFYTYFPQGRDKESHAIEGFLHLIR